MPGTTKILWVFNSSTKGISSGVGDLGIYQNTDKQGLWVGWLNDNPIGCIAAEIFLVAVCVSTYVGSY